MTPQRDIRGDSTQMVAPFLEGDRTQPSDDLAGGNVFDEEWAARHNEEIWKTGPGGMYSSAARHF